jgi:hypothetical protein
MALAIEERTFMGIPSRLVRSWNDLVMQSSQRM